VLDLVGLGSGIVGGGSGNRSLSLPPKARAGVLCTSEIFFFVAVVFHGTTKIIDEDGSDSSSSGSEVMLSSIIQRHDKADADLKTIMYGHVCTHLGGCKYKVI